MSSWPRVFMPLCFIQNYTLTFKHFRKKTQEFKGDFILSHKFMLIPETWGCFGFFGLNNYFFNKKDVGLGYNVLACGRRHPLFFRRHVQCVMIVDKWFAVDDVFFLSFSLSCRKSSHMSSFLFILKFSP